MELVLCVSLSMHPSDVMNQKQLVGISSYISIRYVPGRNRDARLFKMLIWSVITCLGAFIWC